MRVNRHGGDSRSLMTDPRPVVAWPCRWRPCRVEVRSSPFQFPTTRDGTDRAWTRHLPGRDREGALVPRGRNAVGPGVPSAQSEPADSTEAGKLPLTKVAYRCQARPQPSFWERSSSSSSVQWSCLVFLFSILPWSLFSSCLLHRTRSQLLLQINWLDGRATSKV